VFTDVEKQNSYNLFLGIFQPWKEQKDLWDLESDYHLHMKSPSKVLVCNTRWWETPLEDYKKHKLVATYAPPNKKEDKSFYEFYQMYKLSQFDSIFSHPFNNTRRLVVEEYTPIEQQQEEKQYYFRIKKWFGFTNTTTTRQSPKIESKSGSQECLIDLLTQEPLYKYYGIKVRTKKRDQDYFERYTQVTEMGRTRGGIKKVNDMTKFLQVSRPDKPAVEVSKNSLDVYHQYYLDYKTLWKNFKPPENDLKIFESWEQSASMLNPPD